ncbi:MAG TPA: glycosyltransferase [Terracidiphilus sp.]|jgi:glycosyltransferase involved in cell wall biosynthesis
MVKRPTILLLIPHLGGGGAERVTALLSQGLSPQKYDLHLGLITQRNSGSETLPPWVTVHGLGARRVRSAAIALVRLIRLLKPDVILSGMAHLNFLVLLLKPFLPFQTRILIRQNGTVSSMLRSRDSSVLTRLLYRRLYRRADRIVCQSTAMASDLAEQSGVDDSQLLVLPNPVDNETIRAVPRSAADHWPGLGPHLLAIGRLSHEKGFDLLLESFSSLRLKFPHADLTIVGTGPEAMSLKRMRDDLRLKNSVRFAGYVLHPEFYFPGATIFVLSSRHEGLPNALLEAAAAGMPIAALPAAQGIVDLLNGKPGTWVASEISSKALTLSLITALQSLRPRQRFEHIWIEPYRMDRAILAYEDLIDETLTGQLQ